MSASIYLHRLVGRRRGSKAPAGLMASWVESRIHSVAVNDGREKPAGGLLEFGFSHKIQLLNRCAVLCDTGVLKHKKSFLCR